MCDVIDVRMCDVCDVCDCDVCDVCDVCVMSDECGVCAWNNVRDV